MPEETLMQIIERQAAEAYENLSSLPKIHQPYWFRAKTTCWNLIVKNNAHGQPVKCQMDKNHEGSQHKGTTFYDGRSYVITWEEENVE